MALLLVTCYFSGATERDIFIRKYFIVWYYFITFHFPPSLPSISFLLDMAMYCCWLKASMCSRVRLKLGFPALSGAGRVRWDGCSTAFQVNEPKLVFSGFHFVSHSKLALPQMRMACLAHLAVMTTAWSGCLSY